MYLACKHILFLVFFYSNKRGRQIIIVCINFILSYILPQKQLILLQNKKSDIKLFSRLIFPYTIETPFEITERREQLEFK